jgi:hypothetical protein
MSISLVLGLGTQSVEHSFKKEKQWLPVIAMPRGA